MSRVTGLRAAAFIFGIFDCLCHWGIAASLRFRLCCGWLVLAVGCLARPASGGDLSTVNGAELARFRATAERGDRPVTVVSFGDSMADSYRSISFELMNRFGSRLGTAGYSLMSYRNALLWQFENGAETIPPGPFWYTWHYRLPAHSAVWWANQASAAGLWSDRVGVFYAAHPGGGWLRVMVSTNGGPWGQVQTVNAQGESVEGRFFKIDLPSNFHRLRVESLSGTNYLIGPYVINRQSGGVHAVFSDHPGILLRQVTSVPRSIRYPVFQALAPDMVIWHMKEPATAETEVGLAECEEWWASVAPNTDVL